MKLLGLLLLSPLLGKPQVSDLESLKQGVVKIEVGDGANKETATGIVVAINSGRLLILTAQHVLLTPEHKFGQSKIQVFFYSDKRTGVAASRTRREGQTKDVQEDDFVDPLNDIVLLQTAMGADVPPTATFPSYQYLLNSSLVQSEKVWTMNNDWTLTPNTIIRLDHNRKPSEFEYTPVSLGDGYSGGPIFDTEGRIVGIHSSVAKGRFFAVGTKIESAIADLQARTYDLPNLSSAPRQNTTAEMTRLTERYQALSREAELLTSFFKRRGAEVERNGGHLRGDITFEISEVSAHLGEAKRSIDQNESDAAMRALEASEQSLQQLQALK